jgi:predicted helicase
MRANLWGTVPEQDLIDAGLITDINEHRLRRLQVLRGIVDGSENNVLRDTGIDLVVRKHDGTIMLQQLKDMVGSVDLKDLSGFLSSLLYVLRRENKDVDVKGTIVHTSKLSRRVGEIVADMDGFIQEEVLESAAFVAGDAAEVVVRDETTANLYPQQEEAVRRLLAFCRRNDEEPATSQEEALRGYLSMPCGTGKTLVIAELLRRLADAEELSCAVYATPTRQQVRQQAERLRRFLPQGWECIVVDADGAGSTRSVKRVTAALKKGKVLLVSTYASMDVVAEAVEAAKIAKKTGTVMVVDEFHNLSAADVGIGEGADASNMNTMLNKTPLLTTIGVSATPRVFDMQGHEQDDAFFGNVVYRLSWLEAIEQRLIADYKVLVPVLTADDAQESDRVAKQLKIKDIDAPVHAQAMFALTAMLEDGKRRCVVQLPSGPGKKAVQTLAQYKKIFTMTGRDYFGVDVVFEGVLGVDKHGLRKQHIQDFCRAAIERGGSAHPEVFGRRQSPCRGRGCSRVRFDINCRGQLAGEGRPEGISSTAS